jgi:hypothetical protein
MKLKLLEYDEIVKVLTFLQHALIAKHEQSSLRNESTTVECTIAGLSPPCKKQPIHSTSPISIVIF